MKRAVIFTLALVFAVSSLAAPKEKEKEEAWIQQCKNFKVFGISLGMTPEQVRLVFLKAQKSSLYPWSETTPYSSQFRFDTDTKYGPLDQPLMRFLDFGFAPVMTNVPQRSQMRVVYDNSYEDSYPMKEAHTPPNGTVEILPYMNYRATFHDYIVTTNTSFLTVKKLKVRDRADIKVYFNKKHRAVAIGVDLLNMKDEDQEKAFKYMNDNYSKQVSLSDQYNLSFECPQAPNVFMQSCWTNYYTAPEGLAFKIAPPQYFRRWKGYNFYYHETEYFKALEEKKQKDPLLQVL
ncbi:hypothetical protein IKW72_01295 [bacterium]|nr:hypothetical protein [bacterium]